MSQRLALVLPFFCAICLLSLGYLLLIPTLPLLAAPQGVVLQVDRLDDPALPTAIACTGAANDCSLRGAVETAANGDTIEMAVAGTIVLQQGLIALTKDLTITSPGFATHIIDGDGESEIFVIDNGRTVQLSELTLQNGLNPDASGGAVVMNAGTLTMSNMIFLDNVATDKGGALSIIVNGGTANVALSSISFLNNRALDDFHSGGAIHAQAGDFSTINLVIDDARFENNVGGVVNEIENDGYGGAISANTLDEGSRLALEIRASEFISNASGLGGAIYLNSYNRGSSNSAETSLLIEGSRFERNLGEEGGGISANALDQSSATTLDIDNTTFVSNTSRGDGGAVFVESSNRGDPDLTSVATIIRNSTLNNNVAQQNGGAILVGSSSVSQSLASLEMVNVTLSGNRALDGDGGALFAQAGSSIDSRTLVTATHVTAFRNSVGGKGNFSFDESATSEISLYLKNSILAGNAGLSCVHNGITIDGANNLIRGTTCGTGAPFRLGNPLGVIPTLADNGGDTLTHGLNADSSALNAVPAGQCTLANGATVLTTDQRGEPRPFGAACDVGAFEAQTTTLPEVEPITGVTASNEGPMDVNEPITFTATSTGGEVDFYEWDFGDGTTGSGITTTHAYTDGGVYTATVTATNVKGTVSATTEVKVGSTLVGLTASNDGPKTPSDPINFSSSLEEGIADTVVWNYGDGQGGSDPFHTYATAGIYTATVVASNAINTVTATTTVYIGDQVILVQNNFFSPSQVTIAPGSKVVWSLEAGSHSVTAVDGSFEQPAGSDWPPFMHTFTTPGTYEYFCNVHGASMSGTITVEGAPDGLRLPSIIRPDE